MGIWLWLLDKTKYRILVTSGFLLSRKVEWVVWIGSFWPKLEYFTDHNRPKEGPRKNDFLVFSNSEMNITNSQIRKR